MSPISEEVLPQGRPGADRGRDEAGGAAETHTRRTVNRCGSDTLIAALTGFVTGVDRDMLRFTWRSAYSTRGKGRNASRVWRTYARSTTRNRKNSWRPYRGERAKRDVRPQRGRSRHGHLPFRLRPCRWAGLRPRNQMSAGKIKGRKITHGNRFRGSCWCSVGRPGARG